MLVDVLHQLHGDLELLGGLIELVLPQVLDPADLGVHGPHMAHGLDHVAGARLALGADHGRALADPAQGLAQVPGAADEGHLELPLVDVIDVVGGGEHLALVDIVDLDGLEDLGLREVADAALGHHGDGHRLLDALDHPRVAHAGHAPRRPDVRRDALQGHHGAGPGLLGDPGLLRGGHVHNDAALEHLGQLFVQFISAFFHGKKQI